MSITVDQIISEVQIDINDESGQKILRGTYIDVLNSISREIARRTKIWISRYVATPNPNASSWTDDNNYIEGDIIVHNTLYYVCILAHINQEPPNSTYWTEIQVFDINTTYSADTYVYYGDNPDFYMALTATTGNLPTDGNYWAYLGGSQTIVNTVTIPFSQQGVTLEPFKIIRVMRQYSDANIGTTLINTGSWYDTTEYSKQTILSSIANLDSFRINNYDLDGRAFATQFKDRNLNTINGITLVFAKGFAVGDKVVIDYISGSPYEMTQWLNPVAQSIPSYLENVLKYGMLYRIFELLGNRGDKEAFNKSDRAYARFDLYMKDAVYYSQMLKDEQSVITIQPNIFLEE